MVARKQSSALDWVKIQRTEDDWIFYKVVDNRFEIKCGPKNLSESVGLFVDWFDSN